MRIISKCIEFKKNNCFSITHYFLNFCWPEASLNRLLWIIKAYYPVISFFFILLIQMHTYIIKQNTYYLVTGTAEWIKDSSIFYSIQPKLDIGLFVDFCVFTFCMMWSKNCSVLICRTILWLHHTKTGKNR